MKILIIDDEPIVRRALRRAFSSRGHQVFVAADAMAGKELWLLETPDVVMLDVLMPKVTGPQLLSEMKPDLSVLNTKIVLMSAYSGEFDTKLTVHKGAHMFLAKPFSDIFSLANTIEKL